MRESIGTDIIEISRVRDACIRSERFQIKVFTERELSLCAGAKSKWASLAGRFAAKEAIAKAMGTGIRGFCWNDIEVLNDPQGKPFVRLGGKAKKLTESMCVTDIAISISHCKEYAVAFAVMYYQS